MLGFLLAVGLLGDVTVSKEGRIVTDSAIEEAFVETAAGSLRMLPARGSGKFDIWKLLASVRSVRLGLDGAEPGSPDAKQVLRAFGKTLAFAVGFDAGSVEYSYSAELEGIAFSRWCRLAKGRIDTGARLDGRSFNPRLRWIEVGLSGSEARRRDLVGVLVRWFLDKRPAADTIFRMRLTGHVDVPEPCVGKRLIRRVATRITGRELSAALQKGMAAAKLAAAQGRDMLEAALPEIWRELRSY